LQQRSIVQRNFAETKNQEICAKAVVLCGLPHVSYVAQHLA